MTYSAFLCIIDSCMIDRREQLSFGLTGDGEKDGVLTPEQQELLNKIQSSAARSVINYLDQMSVGDPYPMVAMATGIGKGNIIHQVIFETIRNKPDSKILVIAGTKLVLVDQTQDALRGYQQYYDESEDVEVLPEQDIKDEEDSLQDEAGFLYTVGKYGTKSTVEVATIQTLQAEKNKAALKYEDYDLVIVDEVHNIGTQKRVDLINGFSKIVGFTATPYRHTGHLKAPDQYGFTIIESLPLPEAQNLRLLPPLCGIQIETKDLVEDIPMTRSGKIDFKKLEKILKDSPDLRPYIANRITQMISGEGKHYKTVVAVNFVWEAQELAQLLYNNGLKVGVAINQQAGELIHTREIPALDSIDRYKLPHSDPNAIQVLISPYVASEGFDAPFTEALVWASPTDSSLRYTQYTGRLARRAPGKAYGVVVDCLYQTSQYNWSYSFGMWMKGSVKTLDSGMLYLGPEQDIKGLGSLAAIQNFVKSSDRTPLDQLQKEGLLPVQESDFLVIQRELKEIFVGDWSKLRQVSSQVLHEIKDQDSSLVVHRISGDQTIIVVTDRKIFIELMQNKGTQLKTPSMVTLLAVRDTDFPITQNILRAFFSGGKEKILTAANITMQRINASYPELVAQRYARTTMISVVTNRDIFIEIMEQLGVKRKDVKPVEQVQNTDFVISTPKLMIFKGSYRKIMPLATAVAEYLNAQEPGIVASRKIHGQVVKVVTDRQRFIDEMLKRGAKLGKIPRPLPNHQNKLTH